MKIAVGFLIFYLVYLTREILIWLVFALIISVLFNPAVNFFQKWRLPRPLSAILVYVGIFGAFGGTIYLVAPPFFSEALQFVGLFPQYFEKISPPLSGLGIAAFENMDSFIKTVEGWLTEASAGIFSAITVVFGGIFSVLTIFALAIFLSIEAREVERVIVLLAPKRYEEYVLDLWKKCQLKISKWFGSRILLSFFVGFMTFIACYVLNIKYAVSFGLLAGVLDIIPLIGPVIAGIVIVVFALAEGFWIKALFILIILILIQQIEGNILTPILTKRLIGLPAVLVLVGLMVGAQLWGVLGAILAVPLFGILYEFLGDFLKKRKERETIAL